MIVVRGEIRLGEGDDAVVVRFRAPLHALAPPILNDTFGYFSARPVITIERTCGDVAIELRPVVGNLRLKAVEDFLGEAARIGSGFNHEGRHCADDGSLGHPTLAMTRQIAHDLPAARGVPDMNGIREIEMCCQSCEIIGVMIHVVTLADLA